MTTDGARVRLATAADADEVARVLHDFNAEFDEPAPEHAWLAARVETLLDRGDTHVLLLHAEDHTCVDGLALVRLRPSLWDDGNEAYLAELYVRPDLRGRGLGRRLLEATMDHVHACGAVYMDLTTTSADVAAMALYEKLGFDRHERRGPEVTSYYFETDLPRA